MKKKVILIFLFLTFFILGEKDYRIYFHRSTLEIKNEINRIENIRKDEGVLSFDNTLALGILYNAIGRNNLEEKGYGEKALSYLEDYLKMYPENPVAVAQMGTAYGLMVKDTWNIFAKKSYVKKIIMSFEEAKSLEKDKMNLGQIMYQQASVYINMPKKTGLREKGLKLYEEVLFMYEQGDIVFLPELLVTIYYRIAKFYLEEEKEVEGIKMLMKGYDIIDLYRIDTIEAKGIKALLKLYDNE